MIVFSDMDGTLLTSDKQMSDATWAMLDELARRSIEFVPCTGRPLSGVFEPILAHPAVHYAVCANGASVWQLDEDAPTDASRATCILSRPLDRDIAHRIHGIAADHDVTFDIFADGKCFLPRSLYERLDEFCGGDPHIAGSLRRTRTPIDMDVDGKIDEVETLERIAMYWHDPADRDAIAAALDTLECLDLVDLAVDIHVDGRARAPERPGDVRVAAAELVQALVERAGGEALAVGEDIEGDVVAGGNAMDTVGNVTVERTAQNARGARGIGGCIIVELPDAGAVGADRVMHGGVGEDGLKDARQRTARAGHKLNAATCELVEHRPGGVAHLLVACQQRSIHIGKHDHLMWSFPRDIKSVAEGLGPRSEERR